MHARTFRRLAATTAASAAAVAAAARRSSSSHTVVLTLRAIGLPKHRSRRRRRRRRRDFAPSRPCSASTYCGCPWPRRSVTGAVVKPRTRSPRTRPPTGPRRCRLRSAVTRCSSVRSRRHGRPRVTTVAAVHSSYGGRKT